MKLKDFREESLFCKLRLIGKVEAISPLGISMAIPIDILFSVRENIWLYRAIRALFYVTVV